MTDDTEMNETEATALELTQNALADHATPLADASYDVRAPEIVRDDASGSRTSELSCWIYRDDEPTEFIEFEIFRRGRQVVDLADLPTWLDTALEEISRR